VRTLHISIKALFSSGTRGRGRPERENQLTKVYLEKVEIVVAVVVVVVVVVGVVRKGDEHPAYTPHGVCHSFTYLIISLPYRR